MSAVLRLAAGLCLIGLVLWLRGDSSLLLEQLQTAGWAAVATVAVFHTVPMALCGFAWASLLPARGFSSWSTFVLARWVRDGVNQMLPFMPLGGEVIGARMLAVRGVSGSTAAALTVVDITAEVLSQAIFSLIGVGLWLSERPAGEIMGPAGIGIALCIPMLGGLLLAQKLGLVRLMEGLAHKVMPDAWRSPGIAAPVHDGIIAIYAHRRRFAIATLFHLSGWIVACGEAWLALHFIGHPISFGDAIAMESVIYAVRSAAFLVPAGLGVQEGAYVLVAASFGLPTEAALAVSLLKRGRELILGLPALLAWQWQGRASGAAARPQ
jgi:putative membrane protein